MIDFFIKCDGFFIKHDRLLASNSKDQRTYNLIASLAFVELDCIQFDYIHWVELLGTTEWIRTLAFRCYKDKFQRSNHSTRLDIQ